MRQTPEGDHVDAVGAGEGVGAAGEHHEEGRGAALLGVRLVPQRDEMLRSFVDAPFAQFHLHCSPAPIRREHVNKQFSDLARFRFLIWRFEALSGSAVIEFFEVRRYHGPNGEGQNCFC